MSRRKRGGGIGWRAVFVLMALPWMARGGLVWETREREVEALANEREVEVEFRFRNEGDVPVGIVDLVSNCDCTTMEVNKRTFGPGEKGTMTVRVAIEGRSGLQEMAMAVITDDASSEPAMLRLRAKIESLVTLSPPVLTWRLGAEPEEKTVEVNAASSLRIAQLTIAGAYPADAAEARIETVAEGTRYRVHVRLFRGARTRNLTVACSATFEDGTSQELAIHGIVRK